MNDDKLLLTIYARAECHLCEDMFSELKKWQGRYSFNIEIIDIDDDLELTRRFAARIPVLISGSTEICQYFLDENSLIDFFDDVIT